MAQRKLALSDLVVSFLPELRNDFGTTIEDLLRYRVHGVRLSTLQHNTPEEIRNYVLEHGFDGPPGNSIYTNLPAFILGMIIEQISGESLAALSGRYVFGPLHMNATTFFPNPDDCAPTEIDERGAVFGLPHDESAYQFAIAHECAGHAGLFSTVPDLLNFLEALLHPNDGFTKSILAGAKSGLGWQIHGDFLGNSAGPRAFGKTGFTGTSVCVDPSKGIAFVILSNRTYPKRPIDNSAINSFRSDIATIFLGPI
jgi:CubicO group peptidase (beta-lactamase class C family)